MLGCALALLLASPPADSWFPSGHRYRKPIQITAGAPGSPAGYTQRLVFDHKSLVVQGKSSATGDDVVIARWSGSAWLELDRMLDLSSSFAAIDTTIWFQTPQTIAPGADDNDVYLYYGHPTYAAKSSSAAVFMVFDDFEGANLSGWTMTGTAQLWTRATGFTHRGTGALYYPPEDTSLGQGLLLRASPITEGNIELDAWWAVRGSYDIDVSMVARYTTSPQTMGVYANKEVGGMSLVTSTPYSRLTNQGGVFVDGLWSRFTMQLYKSEGRLLQNGMRIVPNGVDEFYDGGFFVQNGTVAIGKYLVPPDGGFWVDDFAVRRFVNPEPALKLDAEQALAVDGGAGLGPTFTSMPGTMLSCGQSWSYRPQLSGAVTIFALEGDGRTVVPDGLFVDKGNGELTWTPTQKQAGTHHLNLIAFGPTGSTVQAVDLVVGCDPLRGGVGCGCASGPGALVSLLLLLRLIRSRVTSTTRR